MTRFEKLKALAELAGWSQIEDQSESLMMSEGTYVYGYPPVPVIGRKEGVPDYLSDLNALRVIELKMDDQQRADYAIHLDLALDCSGDYEGIDAYGKFQLLNAAPDEKAKAILAVCATARSV